MEIASDLVLLSKVMSTDNSSAQILMQSDEIIQCHQGSWSRSKVMDHWYHEMDFFFLTLFYQQNLVTFLN